MAAQTVISCSHPGNDICRPAMRSGWKVIVVELLRAVDWHEAHLGRLCFWKIKATFALSMFAHSGIARWLCGPRALFIFRGMAKRNRQTGTDNLGKTCVILSVSRNPGKCARIIFSTCRWIDDTGYRATSGLGRSAVNFMPEGISDGTGLAREQSSVQVCWKNGRRRNHRLRSSSQAK